MQVFWDIFFSPFFWLWKKFWFSTSVTSRNRTDCAIEFTLAVMLQLHDSWMDADFLSFYFRGSSDISCPINSTHNVCIAITFLKATSNSRLLTSCFMQSLTSFILFSWFIFTLLALLHVHSNRIELWYRHRTLRTLIVHRPLTWWTSSHASVGSSSTFSVLVYKQTLEASLSPA